MVIKKTQFHLLFFIFLISELASAYGQQVLPEFNVTDRNGVVIIGWNNPHPDLTQLIIQKSIDSIKGFRSVMSMPDPTSFSNGYVDKKPGANQYYYRLFYVRPGGRYAFTSAKKSKPIEIDASSNNTTSTKEVIASKIEPVKSPSTSKDLLPAAKPAPKIDSIVKEYAFTPSSFVYTDRDGNLSISLPDAEKKKFSIHVFREDGIELFRIKNIKEPQLLIDRSNFYHSGWFRFILYDDTTLKEENKFFIPPVGK